ncbi:Hpt domain-containing protein, partial [Diaphorobacter nitroreducens]|uniref:Hpt domain-containing protein n=2 Tax=Diaphorobacter nitroreducens TaxID=164759 RepID=UPI0028A9F499
MPGLDTALGLKRASGKPGLYAELLQRFALSQSDVVQNLQAAIQAGDWALAERTAHTLRSVAANLGAQPVSRHAQALEQALRSQAPAETLQPLLAALAEHMAPLLQALGAWARQAPGAGAREATVPPQ